MKNLDPPSPLPPGPILLSAPVYAQDTEQFSDCHGGIHSDSRAQLPVPDIHHPGSVLVSNIWCHFLLKIASAQYPVLTATYPQLRAPNTQYAVQIPDTRYPIPVSCTLYSVQYLATRTRQPSPCKRYRVPDTQPPVTWFPASNTRHPAPDTQQDPALRSTHGLSILGLS